MNKDQPSIDEYIFGEKTRFIDIKKKGYVLRPEQQEKHIYYVLKGFVVLLIESDGNEICLSFAKEGHFISAYTSFLKQELTAAYILATEDSRLAAASYSTIQSAYGLSKEHERNGRLISEQLYIRSNERNMDLICLNAEERYLKFLKHHKEEIQRIPLKYLASYLGITPVSLSRIRAKLNK